MFPPQINGLEIHTKCRESPVGAGMCSAEGSPVIFVNTAEVTSAVWARCSRSKWNPLHHFYEFRKGETIEILSHKLGGGRGGWWGGFTQYWACGGKHERCERLVCVFFYAPWSQIGKKLLGPQEDSGAALEFTDCVFTKGKRACFRHDPVPSLLEGNGVFWLFTVGCVAKIKKSWKATGSCLQCFVVKCVFILIPKLSHVISLSPTLQNLNRLYWYVNTYKELEWLQFLSLLSKLQEQ